MARMLALIVFLSTVCPLEAGRTLRIGGKDFSFSITEPEGWMIDFAAAPQIANFVMYPLHTTWRESDVVAFARFAPKGSQETLEAFLGNNLKEFQQRCPFYETEDVKLELSGSQTFVTKALHCPSMRHEIVAVTEAPGFFITFVLSSNQRNQLQSALPPFRELLSSFLWVPRKTETEKPPEEKP
jgi:hypothetical protein